MAKNKSTSRFREKHHKAAYELYSQGFSFREIAEKLPFDVHYATLQRWSKADYDCDCAFHGWKELEKEIAAQARKEITEKPDAKSELVAAEKEKMRAIKDLQSELLNRINDDKIEYPSKLKDVIDILSTLWVEMRFILGKPTERIQLDQQKQVERISWDVIEKYVKEADNEKDFIEMMEDSIVKQKKETN